MSMAERTIRVNPNNIAGMADPVPILRRLQDEDPVHWSPEGNAWMVTRYDDVKRGFHDRRLAVSRPMPPAEIFEEEFRDTYRAYASSLKTWMVIAEPPDHPRLRKLANRGLTPSAIEGLRPQIAELVERGRNSMARFFAHFDQRLGDVRFVAGDAFTVADITTFVTIRFATRVEVEIPAACGHLKRWFEAVESRPSAAA